MIVAIDPGKTCGWATWTQYEDGPLFRSGEMQWEELIRWLECGVVVQQIELVVCERFDFTAETLTKPDYREPVWIIGGLVAMSVMSWFELELQARELKVLMTDDRLRHVGWWHVGGGGHANDAARHLGAYLVHSGVDIGLFTPKT